MSSLPKIKFGQSSLKLGSPSTRYLNQRERNWDNRFYVEHMREFRDEERLSLYQKLKL